ncbi:unnamed protein product [Moneuplotes crassus]|uniref:EF-hand domain-containing protein n=1 Tax=Euplotes crassus TaxID=5936 RepID=A0AAD2DA96_EUPCR|nr:unnamed protein product [Moneuplotes crassus]
MIMKSSIVNTLKSKVREKDELIRTLKSDIEKSQKDIKKTNIDELMITVNVLTDECSRLRDLLKKSLQKEDSFKTLEQENYQLVEAFHSKEHEVENLMKNIYELNLNIEKQDNTISNLNKVKKLIKDKDRAIMKLKKEIKVKEQTSKTEVAQLKAQLKAKEKVNQKSETELGNQKKRIRDLENQIKELERYKNDKINKSTPESNISHPHEENSKANEDLEISVSPIKDQKKIIDTGSSYPHGGSFHSVPKTRSDRESMDQSKTLTLPPAAKPFSEISAALLQFRCVLRISNVGIKEFLDLIVFKDGSQSLNFSKFKILVQEVMKNYTQDFACFCFNGQPIISREELERKLSSDKVFFELEDYLEEKLDYEFSICKMALKESFDVEDINSLGYISVKQYEEVLENLDIQLEPDLFEFSVLLMFDKHLSVDMLDYPKLFEEESQIVEDNTRELSSIREDSKEENFISKKGTNLTKKTKTTSNQKIASVDLKTPDLQFEEDESVSNVNGEIISRDSNNSQTGRIRNQDHSQDSEADIDFPLEIESLTEQQILDIAEQVFEKTFCSKIGKFTLDDLYADKLEECEYNGEIIKILSPENFIGSFQALGITHLEELEIECLLKVLVKPEIDHKILYEDLVMILENFGVS